MAALPLSAVPVVSLGGGAVTSVVLAMDIAEGRASHPALRNIGLGLGIVNTVLGGLGFTATALGDPGDFAALAYAVSGVYLGLGLTGGGLALAADTYDPAPRPPGAIPEASPGRSSFRDLYPRGSALATWALSFP